MAILPVAFLIGVIQLLFFSLAGLGLVRLLLPPRLCAYELLLSPVFGLALLAVVGFYGAHAGMTMRQLLPAVLVLAVVLLVWATVRSRRNGQDRLPGLLPAREGVPLLLLLLLTWLLNIAPVLSYGTLMPIGDNWDVEFYLPLTDYLKDYSYQTLELAPPNPLRDLLLTERLSSRAMGATYAQSMSDLLISRKAWDTWVPMLALLRVLGLAGLYALLRGGLGVRPVGALAGVLLAGINSLLLWTTFNSFGMGLGGLALLPAALLCTLLALEERDERAIVAAGLLLGGISCTYWPMLMAYGAAGLGVGVALLWERRRGGWQGVVVRGVLVLLVGGAVGLLAHLRASSAFLGVFAMQTPSMGITTFISPATIAGAAPFSHRGLEPSSTRDLVLAWGGLVAALLLLAAGVWRGNSRRLVAAGMAGCVLAYLAGLYAVVAFPYGYLRGASYVNTLLLGLAGAGVWIGERDGGEAEPEPGGNSRGTGIIVTRFLLPVACLFLLASSAVASKATYAVYADHPGVFGLENRGLRAVAATLEILDPDGMVLISSAPELRGPYTAVWAYALRKRELLGMMSTGYQPLVNVRPGAAPAFGVLRRGEDPGEYGLFYLLWHDSRADFYEAPPWRLSWLSGRPTSYTEGGLLLDDTTYTRAQIGVGGFLYALPDQPLRLYASSDEVFIVEIPSEAPPERRGITLVFASYVPQTAEITIGSEQHTIDLPGGVSFYHAGSIETPAHITLRGQKAPLFLRWASLERAEETSVSPHLPSFDNTLLIGVTTTPHKSGAETHIQIANMGQERVRLAVEIYEDVAGYNVTPAHDVWASFPAPLEGDHQLVLDLATPTITFDGAPLELQTGDRRDGSYYAALWVYQGEQVRRVVPFLHFERHGGQVENVTPLDANVTFVRLPQPQNESGVQFGESIVLQGFEMDQATVQPGGALRVSLLWQAAHPTPPDPLMVFVQVLDDTNRKIAQWDGAAGGDWCPTSTWREGQRIWQDVPLAIDPDAPPGHYRVIVGLANPATGERLHTTDGSDMVVVGELDVPPGVPTN